MDAGRDKENDRTEKEILAEKQAMKYAEDLTVIYKEEKAKRRALEVASEKIRAVIDSMSDGMLATDEQCVVIETNTVACQLLDIPRFKEGKQSGDERLDFEVDLEAGFNVRISLSRVLDNKGYVMIVHDITAEKRAEKLKSEFLAILSHELRTPLNGILGFSEILSEELEETLAPDQREYIEMIQKSGNRMLNTVEELLQIARLQSGGIESLDERVSVRKVIDDALPLLKREGVKRGIAIHFEGKGDDAIVKGSSEMLKELFANIIQNSIFFGKEGGEVIIRSEKDNNEYVVSIEDDGIGIPPHELENVFKSFYQVQEHTTRSYEGLGLGLTIAKRIAELHGGVIKLESKVGEGTTCLVRLPLEGVTS